MKKQQNIYLAVLGVVLLLVGTIAAILIQKSNNTVGIDDGSTQVQVEKPLTSGDKQKIITETFGENPDIKDIFALQDILGPEIVMEIDCDNIIEETAKAYCDQEKAFYTDFFNELTWSKVVADGLENIDSVNCDDIVAEAGKQECRDYKNNQ